MKVGIDCRMYGLKHAGIGRYVENLAKELSKRKSKGFKMVLFTRYKETIKPFSHLTIFTADFPHYSWREQVFMPLVLHKAKCDLVHFTHFNVPIFYFGLYVVTIHDLIKHTSRGMQTTTRNPLLYWLKYLSYRFVFWNAIKRAKKIIVPSKWVKRELVKQYKLSPSKVMVTYEGVDKTFRSGKWEVGSGKRILEKYGVKKPFIVYTGSLYPHKNIIRLIKAIKIFNQSLDNYHTPEYGNCLQLVIVCARGVFEQRLKQQVKEIGAEKFVNFIGFVPDEELVNIYQEAVALTQPSLIEGFDLTVIEAMAAGLPVVVSDIPVHREICGQAALYFDPKDLDDMVGKIRVVLKDEALRDKLQTLGLKQAQKYDWKKTIQQTLKTYETSFCL